MPKPNGGSDRWVGVDVGATKLLAGVFDSSLRLVATTKLSTKLERGADAVFARLARCVHDVMDEADVPATAVRGVGIGVSSTVDAAMRHVLSAVPSERRYLRIESRLQDTLRLPVCVGRNGDLATLAVHTVEWKSQPRRMLCLFIGAGIEAGVITDGRLQVTPGEIAHLVLDPAGPPCWCGRTGCFEAMASRTAMARGIQEAVRRGATCILTDALDNLERLRSGDLRRALRRGDPLVCTVVHETAQIIGVAVGRLSPTIQPELVVLGGGVIEAVGDAMLAAIVLTAQEEAGVVGHSCVEIVTSDMGDNAGITGAAILAMSRVG